MAYDPLNIGATETDETPPAVVAGYDPLGLNTSPLPSHAPQEPYTPVPSHVAEDLSWRKGKPKGPIDKLKEFIGLSDNPEESAAKASNALTYSKMLDVSPSFAYDNLDDISKRVKEAAPGEQIDTRTRGGILPAMKAGRASSLAGMIGLGKVPEPFESLNEFERFAEMGTRMAYDLPFFLLGGEIAGPAKAWYASGKAAGGFGFAGGLRQMLTDHYQRGDIKTPGEFFERAINAAKQTVAGQITGKAMEAAGKLPGPGIAKTGYELAGMTTTASILEGHLPGFRDFTDPAAMLSVILGGKVAKDYFTPKLYKLYSKYGAHPDDVAQAVKDSIPGNVENPTQEEVLAALHDLESELQEKTALKPAIKKADGEVIKGKLGQTHEDILRNEPGIVFDENAGDQKVFVQGTNDEPLPRKEAKQVIKDDDPETYQNWVALNGKGKDGELHSIDYAQAAEIIKEPENDPQPGEAAQEAQVTDYQPLIDQISKLPPEQPIFGGEEQVPEPTRFSVFNKSETPKSRTIGDVLSDINDVIGKGGHLGDKESSSEREAAKERLRRDVDTLIDNAAKAGKELGAYLKDLGYDDATIEQIMAFAGASQGTQGQKEKEATPIFNEKPGPAASPITEANAPDYIGKAWNKIKNAWIGEKDVAKSEAQIEARLIRRDLLNALGYGEDNPFGLKGLLTPGKGEARDYIKDINRAIQIYIDTKRDPEAIARTEGLLTEEQQRILDLSQNLPKEVMPIVEKIQKAYEDIAKTQYDAGLVENFLDNFVNRVWNLDEKGRPSDDSRAKFGLKSRHAKQRQFETILDGWGAGYDLKVEGAIDSLKIMREEISRVVANRDMLDAATKARDIHGRPLLATPQGLRAALQTAKNRLKSAREDLEEIKGDPKKANHAARLAAKIKELERVVTDIEKGHRKIAVNGFKKWEWAGKIEAATTERITQSRKVLSETISKLAAGDKTPSSKVEAKVKEALQARGWSEGEANQMIERVKGAEPGDKQSQVIERTIENTIIKEIQTEIDVKQYGRDFFIKDGNIYENRELYGREDIAKNIENMLNKVHAPEWIDKIAKYNAISKAYVLASGFFHNIAGMYNYYLGTGKVWKDMSVRKAYKEGMKNLEERNPVVMHLIKNGLTIGARQDWQERYLQESTWFGKQVDKLGYAGDVKDKLVELRQLQSDFLFEEFFPGLKVMQGLDEYKGLLERHPDIDPDKAAQQASGVTNANYGGLKLEQLGKWNPTHEFRMGRNPTNQYIFHLLALAPDWTESNLELVGNALKGVATGSPQELEVYQRLVAKWAIRGTGALAIGNFVLAGGDLDKMIENFERSWKEGNLNWMRWDITPIYRMFGGDESKHKYLSAFGHMEDPIKAVLHPGSFLKNKSSVVGKTLLDGITGRNWQGKAFTEFGDLWQTGKATKWSATAHPIDWSTFPAYAITEIVGTEPIQFQNLLGWTMGQEDGFDAILKSTGLRENSAKPKGVK